MPKKTKNGETPGKVNKIISDYIKLKKEIESLTSKLDEKKPGVIDYLEKNGGKDEYDGKQIYLQTNKSYSYSKEVDSMALVLKNTKKQEEANGTAKCTLSTSLVVKDRKS